MVEDLDGLPFVGPAGNLLNDIIEVVTREKKITCAITNLICCIPRESAGVRPPSLDEKSACSHRLFDFLGMADPRGIVLVGEEAGKEFTKHVMDGKVKVPTVEILHPAAILRRPVHQQANFSLGQVSKIINFLEAMGVKDVL